MLVNIFLGLYMLFMLGNTYYLKKYQEADRIVSSLVTIISFIMIYIMFFTGIISIIVLYVLIAVFMIETVICIIKNKLITDDFLYLISSSVLNNIVLFIVVIYLPVYYFVALPLVWAIIASLGDIFILIVLSKSEYLGMYSVRSKVIVILGIVIIVTWLPIKEDKNIERTANYLYVPTELVEEPLNIEQITNIDINLEESEYLIHNDTIYALLSKVTIEGTYYPETVFVVYDLKKNEVINTISFHNYDLGTISAGSSLFESNDNIYINSSTGVHRYLENHISSIYEGETILYKTGVTLKVLIDKEVYMIDGDELTLVDILPLENRQYNTLNNHLFTRVGRQHYVSYFEVAGMEVYEDELYYVADDFIISGRRGYYYFVTNEGNIEMELNVEIEDGCYCDGKTYLYWRPSMVINDFPYPVILEYNSKFELVRVHPEKNLLGITCDQNKLIGVVKNDFEDINIIEYNDDIKRTDFSGLKNQLITGNWYWLAVVALIGVRRKK